MKGPWKLDGATGDGSDDGTTLDEGVGATINEGRRPVGPTTGSSTGESTGSSRPPDGSLGDGVGSGTALGEPLEAGTMLDAADVPGRTMSGIGPSDGLFCAGGNDRTGSSSSSGSWGRGVGDGGGRKLPVPGGLLLRSGEGVTTMSCEEVTVPVVESLSLLLEKRLEDESGRLKKELNADVKSSCLDSSCSDDVLEDSVLEDSVGAAGAVELVTIWRFTCRGK